MHARKMIRSGPLVWAGRSIAATALLISTASTAASCAVVVSGINFGSYDPLSHSQNDSSANIQVNCSHTAPAASEVVSYTLALTAGSGSYAARTMLRGATPLTYNLYTTAARNASEIWGDGSGGSITVSGMLPALSAATPVRSANHTLYGRIPARQDIPVGTYSANVILTMLF